MNLITCLLTKNECYKKGQKIKPKGVMVHSTGANNPNISRYVQPNVNGIGTNKYNNHWNRSSVKKCVHAFIGKLADGSIATCQTLPLNYRGWHAGSGKKGSANDTHLSFEICEDNLKNKDYFTKVYNEAVEFTAYLCKEFDLNPLADGVIICHKEGNRRGVASNHHDVEHWFPKYGKTMDDFRADVAENMGMKEPDEPTEFTPYLVKITASTLNVRKGAGTNYPIVTTVKKGEVYTIVDEDAGWGLLKSKVGWIKLSYTKPYTK